MLQGKRALVETTRRKAGGNLAIFFSLSPWGSRCCCAGAARFIEAAGHSGARGEGQSDVS